MPRYYFHIHNDEVTIDEEGTEIGDDSAAMEWAKVEARYMASVSVKDHAHLVLRHKIVVVDEDGRDIGAVRFGDVVAVEAD